MPHPCPHHCPPERGGQALAVAAILVGIGLAVAARPVVNAARDVLEVVAIVITAISALAGLAAGVAVAVWLHRQHARTRLAVPRHTPALRRGPQALSAPRPRAIEAPTATLADLERLRAEHGYVIRQAQDDD